MKLISRADYPQDTSFISTLSRDNVARIERYGFNESKVIFFEIPFCLITAACAGIIKDYQHKIFYKALCFSRGLLETLSDMELTVILSHEHDELLAIIHDAMNAEPATLITIEEEQHRHLPEVADLKAKFGEGIVESALIKGQGINLEWPAIPRYIFLYWAQEWVVEKHNEVSCYSFPMSENMLQPHLLDGIHQFYQLVMKEYGSAPSNRFMIMYKSAICAVKG